MNPTPDPSFLPTEWLKFFQGVDVTVMVAIGIIAFMLEYSQRVPDGIAVMVPAVLGGLWGLAEAFGEGYGTLAHVLKGVLVNCGAASILGRGVNVALRAYWNATAPAPAPPHP